ncbi:MAG: hypothetical protein R8M11_00415 [Gallionella sp.]
MTQYYNPDCIGSGIHIPLPNLAKFSASLKKSALNMPATLREEVYSDHIHFTLVMTKDTRQLIYSACNLGQDQFIKKVPCEGKKTGQQFDAITDSINAGETAVFKGRAKGKIKLANAGGRLMLFNKRGCVIDHVKWSKSQLHRVKGRSCKLFERDPTEKSIESDSINLRDHPINFVDRSLS